MLAHGLRPGIIGSERKTDIAELGQHQGKIAGRAV